MAPLDGDIDPGKAGRAEVLLFGVAVFRGGGVAPLVSIGLGEEDWAG